MANSTEIKLIAQAHAQQYNKQQNDYYLQMANNMIAENHQNEKYLQMANDMIANENKVSQPVQTQNVQPVETVQQKTVSEVKKIPSIVDFGKNQDNKTYIQKVIEQNILKQQEVGKPYGPMIEEARAQKQNEPSTTKEQRKEDSAPIGSGINQVDISKYNLPINNGFTNDDIKAYEDYDKAVAWTQPDYRLTKEEQKEAKRIARQGIERLEKPTENTTGAPVYVGRSVKDMTPEEQKEYQMYKDLELRSNGFLSGAVGAADKLLQQGESLANTELQLSKKYGDLFSKLGIITPEEADRAIDALENARQGVKDFDKDYVEDTRKIAQGAAPIASPTIPILNQQVDITPYGTGQMGTQIAEYFLTNPVFDALGDAAKVGKAGKFLINQIGQNLQDVALDTSFLVSNALDDGEITEDEANEIKSNMAWNAAFNLGLGALGEVPGLVKKVVNNKAAKKAAQNIPEIADAIKQTENAAENIDNLTKQIPNIEDATDIYKGIDNYNVDLKAPETPKVELPAETFNKLDSHFEELARPMNDVKNSGIMDKVTDAKALKEWQAVNEAYDSYIAKAMDGTVEEVEVAKKTFDNARKRYARAMKDIDPEISKQFNSGSYGNLTGRPLYERNIALQNEANAQATADVINELENLGTEKSVAQSIDNVPQGANKVMAAEMGSDVPVRADVPETTPFKETYDVKERGLSKHIVGEDTPMKMEGVSDEVVADFKENPDLYVALKNSDTLAKAEKIYEQSANAEAEFRKMLAQKDPAALPLGHQLAKDYSAAGNHEAAAEIYRAMGNELTKAGQFSQAAAINMMKNDPMTALRYAERQIDNLNQTGKQRFGAKWKDFELTDAERQLFNSIAPGDEEAIKSAFDQIGARIGKDYPTTLMDKLLEGRKIAMLFNVRTNVRNFGANVPTLGMRWIADRFEALGQNAAHLINPDVKVTQSLTGSGIEGRKLATEVFNSKKVQALLNDAPGKYEIPDLKNSLTQNKQMYKGTAFEKWIDNVTDGGIQKINSKLFGKEGVQSGLETIRNATYKMLDLGDSPFVKENFVERLGSYINAQGIKNIDDVPDEAIQMAWEEAMKATYKDNSWAVQMLSGLKGGIEKIPGVGRPLSQAAIPFLQAPGNIAARMIDYSPIKATKGIADIVAGATKNDAKTISKGIEEAAKGLTGTGLILLGMRLRDSGILTGTYSKDKDQKAFEKQNGFREFALHVGDKYFTYDWAQPFAEPLIIGTLLADAINKSDEYNSDLLTYFGVDNPIANKALGVATEGAKASLNSWFNASPLQGLQELLSGGYNGTDIAQNIIDTGVSDFAGAFVPATVNAVAKSVDTTQRNTYDPSNRVSTFVNQQIAKIPGLSKTLPAKYDTWGNEMKYADSQAMATASRFVIPGDYSYDRDNPTDKEINRLFEATNDAAVFPQVAPNKVGDKKLNNKEVSTYQQDMGTRSRELVEEFISSDVYKTMDDTNKADTISNLYGVSKAITERDKFGKEPANTYIKAIEAYDNAGGGKEGAKAVADYYTTKTMTDEAGLSASTNAAKEIKKDIENGDMDSAQQKIDAAQQLPTLGLDKPGPVYTYYNAQKQIPGLTVEDFATTYKAIDTDKNQGIKQDEVIDYLNKNKITSQSEANEIWSAYGNSEWKYIPSIKDGVWTKKKK